MRDRKAVENFIGRNGTARLNCAQSVAAVFLADGLLSREEYDGLAECGYGRAPEGYCGSAYAAMRVLEKLGPKKVEQFKNDFAAYAKSLACKEIRGKKEIKCSQTVKKAAELAEKILGLQ